MISILLYSTNSFKLPFKYEVSCETYDIFKSFGKGAKNKDRKLGLDYA